MMATELGETKILNLLGQDVRSSELYYRNNCHTNFKRRYEQRLQEEEFHDKNSALEDFVALTAVKDFVDDSPQDTFILNELENIYLEKLAERGKVTESHITRFATLLKEANMGLTVIQPSEGGKYTAVKTKRLQSIIPDSDWIQLLRKVVEPIRDEIFEIHDMKKHAMSDLSTEFCPLPHNKLSFMMTLFCNGEPDFKNIPLPLDTMCQQIILNTK